MAWKPPQRAGATVVVWAGYSLAERDRRWQAVRDAAGKANRDCIFVPLGNGTDGRYLTQLRCSSIVLPTDGKPPIIIADRSSRNEWVPEPWQTSREWAEPMVQALLESGMERARIGVVGLQRGRFTHVRARDGVINYSAFAEVVRRLPNASFEDATDVVGSVRYVKSDEELGCLKQGVAIAEAGIQEMMTAARPGLDAAVLYAQVMGCLLEAGSEYFPLGLALDPIDSVGGPTYRNPPSGRKLEVGTLINNEVHAIWGAQIVQESQPLLIGRFPERWRPVIEFQREVFSLGLERMRPGHSLGEMIDALSALEARRGLRATISLQGCGYGDDGPLFNPEATATTARDVRFEKNSAWVWKPVAMSADGKILFGWGGSVVVSDKGGERLGKRDHGLVTVG